MECVYFSPLTGSTISMIMGLLFGGLSGFGAYQLGQDPKNYGVLLREYIVFLHFVLLSALVYQSASLVQLAVEFSLESWAIVLLTLESSCLLVLSPLSGKHLCTLLIMNSDLSIFVSLFLFPVSLW